MMRSSRLVFANLPMPLRLGTLTGVCVWVSPHLVGR